jgi:hypothetical protein
MNPEFTGFPGGAFCGKAELLATRRTKLATVRYFMITSRRADIVTKETVLHAVCSKDQKVIPKWGQASV